jgi:hypothetical protein
MNTSTPIYKFAPSGVMRYIRETIPKVITVESRKDSYALAFVGERVMTVGNFKRTKKPEEYYVNEEFYTNIRQVIHEYETYRDILVWESEVTWHILCKEFSEEKCLMYDLLATMECTTGHKVIVHEYRNDSFRNLVFDQTTNPPTVTLIERGSVSGDEGEDEGEALWAEQRPGYF